MLGKNHIQRIIHIKITRIEEGDFATYESDEQRKNNLKFLFRTQKKIDKLSNKIFRNCNVFGEVKYE